MNNLDPKDAPNLVSGELNQPREKTESSSTIDIAAHVSSGADGKGNFPKDAAEVSERLAGVSDSEKGVGGSEKVR